MSETSDAGAEPAEYEGGCHCGRVRFRVRVKRHEALDCNCSLCAKKGLLHLIVNEEDFELLQGEAAISVYEFNTRVAKHRFCRYCGVQSFYTPRSHPDQVDVNVRCLDGDVLTRFSVRPFDGKNWERAVDAIR
jgi:hypothetical protein